MAEFPQICLAQRPHLSRDASQVNRLQVGPERDGPRRYRERDGPVSPPDSTPVRPFETKAGCKRRVGLARRLPSLDVRAEAIHVRILARLCAVVNTARADDFGYSVRIEVQTCVLRTILK